MLSSQNIEKLERELQGRTFSISDVHAIAPNVSRAYAKDRVRKWYDKSMVERVRKGVYRFR